MNGETLTYEEIIERSRKYMVKRGKKELIASLIMSIVLFVFILLLAKDLAMASVIGSIPIIVMTIVYLCNSKRRKYGINKELEPYKDIINNYNLVYDDFKVIYTKSHIFNFVEDYYDDTWSVTIVCLNDIETVSISKFYSGKQLTCFNIYIKNAKRKYDKLKVMYLPDIFKEILKEYIIE